MSCVLAIDPGPVQSAYCLFEYEKPTCFGTENNQEILDEIRYRWSHRLDLPIVIEMIASYGMPVGKEVFETCVWIGRFMEATYNTAASGNVYRMTRQDVKLHICKSPKANDSTIIQALKDRFGEKGTKKNPGILYGIKADEWQALALAVTYAETKLD